jgi:hypothetical protein
VSRVRIRDVVTTFATCTNTLSNADSQVEEFWRLYRDEVLGILEEVSSTTPCAGVHLLDRVSPTYKSG